VSRRKFRKKQMTLDRANQMALPGGAMMYVPPGGAQSTYSQTFYGSRTKNTPTGQVALFTPGSPLQPQQGINPNGQPIAYRYPFSFNTFPVDRTSQNPDIPSFQQLRNLAKLYNGVTLCERCWLDLVPRMKLKIELKPEYAALGADEKDYQADISYFLTWFESPDKMHDLHSWLRMCLREQTQIDELYIYKRKKRGGGLHALELVAGDQVKPLLDDWGKIPQPPDFAYQQYPWGIPGAWFRSDEMIHYQESPAADNPYGQSRVERIIMLVNQGLRKQKKDLSHFTEGNIPSGMMLVPDDATWTPDQIDAFEQAWNALLAGNAQQQVRMRFTQPGMKYQPFEQYGLDPTFDKFILNIAVSAYGMSMQDLAFTEDIHKSSGDSQQNVTYRRTIDPLAVVYASFLTQSMNTDFPPEYHGEMFQASFGGYDEEEDVSELAGAYSTLVTSGILGITNAGKLLKLPDDPNAPYIGRILVTKDGPVFLDDMASDKMRNAQMQAQMAGYKQASSPQQPAQNQQKTGEEEQQSKENEQKTPENEPADQTASTTPQNSDEHESEQETETPEETAEHENEISTLLKQDTSEPFTQLERMIDVFERHEPGGHDHDQKTHGDFAHPGYGAKHDKTPANQEAMQAEAKAQPAIQAADKAVQAAQAKVNQAEVALAGAATPAAKAQARAALDQARTDLRKAKDALLMEKAKAKDAATAERAKAKQEAQKLAAEKKAAAAKLHAQKMKAHLQKQAQAASAKAARMQATAQHKAQIAAGRAAKSAAKSGKAQAHAQLQAAKQQQKAAKVLASLVNTLGAKATLYNALAGRKLSKTWNAQDSQDASAIASDFHALIEMVNSHANEGNAKALVQQLTQSVSKLQGQKGITSARSAALDKLIARIQSQLALNRSVGDDNSDEWLYDDPEEDERFDDEEIDEEAGIEERRYTIGELLHLLQEQMQAKATDQRDGTDLEQPIKARSVDTGNGNTKHATSSNDETSDYKRWRGRAIEDVKAGKSQRGFTTTLIPDHIHRWISDELPLCTTPDEVRSVFSRAKNMGDEPLITSREELARGVHSVFSKVAQRGHNELITLESE